MGITWALVMHAGSFSEATTATSRKTSRRWSAEGKREEMGGSHGGPQQHLRKTGMSVR